MSIAGNSRGHSWAARIWRVHQYSMPEWQLEILSETLKMGKSLIQKFYILKFILRISSIKLSKICEQETWLGIVYNSSKKE